MLADRVKEWTQEWLEEGVQKGRQEGLQKGRQEGRQEGEAQMLLRQLERKFGVLPDSRRQRILKADADTLLVWADRVLSADRWEDIVTAE